MLIIVSLLLPVLSFSQDIPKNANTITVKGVGFDNAVNILLDSGYKIDKIDKEYYTIQTEYKKLCTDCLPEMLISLRIKDSTATITGKWRSTGNFLFPLSTNKDTQYIFEIKNEKPKVPRLCFQKMNNFALSLHGEIAYTKL